MTMNRVCALTCAEFPLFAFSHCRDVVAAVSKAGGFGVLGATRFTPEQLEEELDWIDAHVDGAPYGVDVLVPEVVDKIGRYAETGQSRLYLQTLDLGDLDHLRLVAEQVVPQIP